MKHIRVLLIMAIQFSIIHLTDSHLSAQPAVSGYKNLPAEPPEPDQHAVPWLPFEENWSTGLFETNQWETEGNGNWRIAGQLGNEAPSVEFYKAPASANYHKTLTSRLLNARNLIDGNIFLVFDLKLNNIAPTGKEVLKAQVFADTGWTTVWADSNLISFEWKLCKTDITEKVKGKIFMFRFMAEGHNSLDINSWFIDNISVIRKCAPPKNFTAFIDYPNLYTAMLEWDPPLPPNSSDSLWLNWDNQVNNDAIGLSTGGTFTVASRFTPEQLLASDWVTLVKVRFFPYAEASFDLKVWTGNNATQLIYSQMVDNPIIGSWNEIVLSEPVTVSTSDELWFGYTVTHEAGQYPAGIDSGPAITGFGDLISQDGITWESMSTAYGLNYNWNLSGQIVIHEINTNHQFNSKRSEFHKSNVVAELMASRSFLYYNIYENNQLIDTTSGTVYYHYFGDNGFACYTVQAVYSDCLSDHSDEVCLYIESQIQCYPVPAHDQLSITLESDLSSLSILDFNSFPLYEQRNIQKGTLTVNTAEFRNGLYLIRAFDHAGKSHSAKFVVQH